MQSTPRPARARAATPSPAGGVEIDFLRPRRVLLAASMVLLLASLIVLGVRGLNFGIEFTGGVMMEVEYPQAAELDTIRSILQQGGHEGALVQTFGGDRNVLIRLGLQAEDTGIAQYREDILSLLRGGEPRVELRSSEVVSPQVGAELAEEGALAALFALLMILAYVSFRFQWKFSLGAVAALVHDVVLTLGIFSALQIPFDLSVLAAVLAVIGYSLNDTIVIFDRVRENFMTLRRETPERVMNLSLNQTLSRTLVTGITTLLVLFALLLVGGDALYGFSLALIIGVVVGTYSSVYLATALALALKITPLDLMPPKSEEDEELSRMP